MTLWIILLAIAGLAYCACCCQPCEGPTCCGDEFPGLAGECCDGEWRFGDGSCCDGQWYAEGVPGKCCDDVWETGAGQCCDSVWYTEAGTCCDNQWYPEGSTGECCDDVWHTDEGQCCSFTDAFNVTHESWCVAGRKICGEHCLCVQDDWDCEDVCEGPGEPHLKSSPPYSSQKYCKAMCCTDGECSMVYPWECAGELDYENRDCTNDGCPAPCCEELSSGLTQCAGVPNLQCVSPRVQGESCEDACKGECCIDGVSQGQTTREACDSLGGVWSGLGSTTCLGPCRPPFDNNCCETATSGGYGLTFTQPLLKRTPPFNGTVKALVTGTTDSPILIHGALVGIDPTKHCAFSQTVLLCGDSFNIEPVPCGSRFRNLNVTVCWSEEPVSQESLNFSGCNDITVWLGQCERNCVTTMTYSGAGHTSNASILVYGNATLEANGGALVLTSNIAQQGSACSNTLTLSGTSTAANAVNGDIPNRSGGATSLVKTGSGTWRLAGNNTFDGRARILGGTLVVARNTGAFSGALGTYTAGFPALGDPAANAAGSASLLVASGITLSVTIVVEPLGASATQSVAIGSEQSGTFSGTLVVGRSVIIQAGTGGTLTWSAPVNPDIATRQFAVTCGSAGNNGTIVFNQGFPQAVGGGTGNVTAFSVVNGIVVLSSAVIVDPRTPVTLDDSLGLAELQVPAGTGVPALGDLTFLGTSARITGDSFNLTKAISGLPRSTDSDAATVSVTGTGHEITANVSVNAPAIVSGAGTLLISGVVSGGSQVFKDGSGTLRLSGANTYTAGTVIDGGTVKAENISALGTGPITVNAGGTLNKNGYALANAIYINGGTVIP